MPLAQLQEKPFLQARLAKFSVSADGEFVQVPLAQITWYHHISLIPKVKDVALRAFYITETAIQGWNRDIMLMQIEDKYHTKTQALPNNFDTTLPPVHSDLAKAAFKDPYNFGFVDMTKVMQEKDLEDQLASKVTDFLLELGKGFSYLGKQYPLNISGEDSKVDIMIKVEYAMRGMTQPLGVAEYQTKQLMENLKTSLPTIDDLEKTLNEQLIRLTIQLTALNHSRDFVQ